MTSHFSIRNRTAPHRVRGLALFVVVATAVVVARPANLLARAT